MRYLLGISLLQESTPELVALAGVEVDEFPVAGRKSVIHTHVHPPTVLPEPTHRTIQLHVSRRELNALKYSMHQ